MPRAVSRVPSSGSTATSTIGPVPSPTSSPLNSIGASSFSPSPITTTPRIATVSSMRRIASTAAWSAAFLSPRPIQRDANVAADSVTRTSSSARFLSGTSLTAPILHPFRRVHSHEVQALRYHVLDGQDECEPKGLLLGLEDAMLVVEAVEVVGHADRVDRDRMWCAALGRLACDLRELEEPFYELALLARQLRDTRRARHCRARIAQDPGDPRVRVLHVVDGVLVRLLPGEV